MNSQKIMILGVGCILFSDEGFGVRVIEKIQKNYTFPDNVTIVDGGVLGVFLLGVISQPDHSGSHSCCQRIYAADRLYFEQGILQQRSFCTQRTSDRTGLSTNG